MRCCFCERVKSVNPQPQSIDGEKINKTSEGSVPTLLPSQFSLQLEGAVCGKPCVVLKFYDWVTLGKPTELRAVLSQEEKKNENQLKGSQSNMSVTDDRNWDICENSHAEPEGDNLLSGSNRRVPSKTVQSHPHPAQCVS